MAEQTKPTPEKRRIKVEYTEVAALKAAEYNPRQMPDAEMMKLERSLAEFGVVDPIIARRDGEVIGGHQRLEAAAKLGHETVPVVYLDNITDAQAKTLNLALNRISGEWDMPKLGEMLVDMGELDGVDLSMTGFDAGEMGKAVAAHKRDTSLTDPDAVPDVPKKPRLRRRLRAALGRVHGKEGYRGLIVMPSALYAATSAFMAAWEPYQTPRCSLALRIRPFWPSVQSAWLTVLCGIPRAPAISPLLARNTSSGRSFTYSRMRLYVLLGGLGSVGDGTSAINTMVRRSFRALQSSLQLYIPYSAQEGKQERGKP